MWKICFDIEHYFVSGPPLPPTGYHRQEGHNSDNPRKTPHSATCSDSDLHEDKKLCKICWERPVEITLSPCGHLVLCEPCSRNVTQCPICRKEVVSSLRTYFYGNWMRGIAPTLFVEILCGQIFALLIYFCAPSSKFQNFGSSFCSVSRKYSQRKMREN